MESKKELIRTLIGSTGGTFFSVKFVKRTTGELRRMVCRTGVKRGVKGIGLSFDPKERDLVVVWDVLKRSFRMIPLEGVKELKVRKVLYRFE